MISIDKVQVSRYTFIKKKERNLSFDFLSYICNFMVNTCR